FYRQEAFLAIVFITDAAIRGPLTAKATFDMLLQLKNSDREKLAAYAALIPPDNPNRCQYDDQWNQDNLNVFIDFLSFFDGAGWGRTYFDLCSPNFGDELANIGKDLENKIEMFIPLKEFPVIETIQIKYGEQVIPQDAFFGWSYVENRVGILLGKGLKLKEQKDAELTINYIPAKVN
ncbi:MAG: hypothetical protein KDD40_11990, partial [Bdellovibrionales bacterium]|nr:hypothetical protein [Bdellovibrionales bacterium]